MSKELNNEKTVTIKELSELFEVSKDVIIKRVKELFPDKMQHGKTTYLNEYEVTLLKKRLLQNSSLISTVDDRKQLQNINTELERNMIVMQAFNILQEDNVKLKEENNNLQLKLEQAKPAIEFTNQVLKSKDSILIRDFAKIIKDENINIGEKRLFTLLRDNNILMKNNIPYQKYMDMGLFEVIEKPYNTPYGIHLSKTTMITPKGQIYFVEKIRKMMNKKLLNK